MKADVGTTTSSNGSNGTHGGSALARCVVLCPRSGGADAVLPDELRLLLDNRASSMTCFSEPLSALAAMVVHERDFSGGRHKDPMLLILVEPARLAAVEALVAAMSKYAHRAAVWQYDPASAKRLARYVAPVVNPSSTANGASNGAGTVQSNNGAKPRSVAAAAPAFVSWVGMPGAVSGGMSGGVAAPKPAPRLRLAGEAAHSSGSVEPSAPSTAHATGTVAPTTPAAPAAAPKVRPELTDEEMAMLLGPGRNGAGGTRP